MFHRSIKAAAIIIYTVVISGCGPDALIKSANYGDVDKTQEIILGKSSDVNVVDANGDTPLIHAAWKGHSDIVKLLLNHGADVNHRDNAGQTALHLATGYKHNNIVKLLIDNGADVNAKKVKRGSTPLILAAKNNNIEAARMLIEAGADVNFRDNFGNTALDYAESSGNHDVASVLAGSGAVEGRGNKELSDWMAKSSSHDLCKMWKVDHSPSAMRELRKRNMNCEEYMEGDGHYNFDKYICDKPGFVGVLVSNEDKKSIAYMVERKYLARKMGREAVCIQQINVKDVIKIRGNKIVKYSAKVVFPQGYRMDCQEMERKAKEIERKGGYSWNRFLATTTGGCTPFSSLSDPLGYIAQPGEIRVFDGEVEI